MKTNSQAAKKRERNLWLALRKFRTVLHTSHSGLGAHCTQHLMLPRGRNTLCGHKVDRNSARWTFTLFGGDSLPLFNPKTDCRACARKASE
jgi:hypothetical protein